jgi:hypothetical protein
MTTILEEPYMMRAKPKKGESLLGNDQYEGYCKVRFNLFFPFLLFSF